MYESNYHLTKFSENIGGIFSLFLGCSFVTIIEVIYFAIIRLWIFWNRNNRINDVVIFHLKHAPHR